jgi:peptidoglycan/LPS O-acetylase OafA/YrhL
VKNLNLEALRGIFALMVLISHVALIRLYFGYSDDYLNPILFHLGRIAVTGFFVLSGYLITYNILKRKESNEWNIEAFIWQEFLEFGRCISW